MSTTPSPLEAYLASGLTASSPVPSALLLAPSNTSSNVLTEEMENLQLPATVNLFESGSLPAPYSANPSVPPTQLSLLGMSPTTTFLLVGVAAILIFGSHK